MIVVLFIALIALAGVAYVVEHKDILSPWVISCIMFLVSAFFALANAGKWGHELSPEVVIVIITGLVAFGLASLAVSLLLEKNMAVNRPSVIRGRRAPQKPYEFPLAALAVILLLQAVIFVFIYSKTYTFSVSEGNQAGPFALSQMISFARQGLIQPGKTLGRLAGHLKLISESFQLVFLFFFLYNSLLCSFRKKWLLYLLPVALDFGTQILGTGRAFMINMAASVLIMGFVMYNFRYGWNRNTTLRIVLAGMVALLLFFLFFTLLGYLTGKSKLLSVWDMVSVYTGLSIPSLDIYLHNPPPESAVWGQETLYGLHSILRTLGMDLPVEVRHLEFVTVANGSTGNVYTSLRRYINDYGYMGMLVVQFVIGAFYTLFYKFIQYKKTIGFSLILYSWFFYALVMQGIDDILMTSMISTTLLYKTTYLLLIFYGLSYLSNTRRKQSGKSAPEASRCRGRAARGNGDMV